MVTEKKWVYKFNEGNAQMRELLGGKKGPIWRK